MTRLRLVIFDCDGVLIDSEAVSNRVLAEELTGLGWAMTGAECERRFIGTSFHDIQTVIEGWLGHTLPAVWLDALVVRVADAMSREAVLIDGAIAALRSVAALGLDWCVASNSSHRELAAKFGCTGLTSLVVGRVHSTHNVIAAGGRAKPAPDLFLRAARAVGVPASECLVIEDSAPGAQAAGMDCLGFCPKGDGASLEAEGAVLFRSLHDLPDLLRARV